MWTGQDHVCMAKLSIRMGRKVKMVVGAVKAGKLKSALFNTKEEHL